MRDGFHLVTWRSKELKRFWTSFDDARFAAIGSFGDGVVGNELDHGIEESGGAE